MPDTLSRVISKSGRFFGIACDTTSIVNHARKRHDLGPVAAAALGRSLSGAILLAALLKDDQHIQLIFEGNGPLGKVVSEAGSFGWCRGYVANPKAELPLKDGLIDVAGGIGRAGFLRVTKDIGLKEKYTGMVQLFTSEVAEDIAYYLTESEQTPSTMSLGVMLQPDGTIAAAGGYLIQSLPPADDTIIKEIESSTLELGATTALLSSGRTPAEILALIFRNVPHKHTGKTELFFKCRCSREKMVNVLRTLTKEDIRYLLEQDGGAELKCDFCSERYFFTKDDLNAYINDDK